MLAGVGRSLRLCCLIITVQIFVAAEGEHAVTTILHLHTVCPKTLDAAHVEVPTTAEVCKVGHNSMLNRREAELGWRDLPTATQPDRRPRTQVPLTPGPGFLSLPHSQVQAPRRLIFQAQDSSVYLNFCPLVKFPFREAQE